MVYTEMFRAELPLWAMLLIVVKYTYYLGTKRCVCVYIYICVCVCVCVCVCKTAGFSCAQEIRLCPYEEVLGKFLEMVGFS